MTTQYKMIFKKDPNDKYLLHFNFVPEDYVGCDDENVFVDGLFEDDVNYLKNLSHKKFQSLIKTLMSQMMILEKFRESLKKMNVSEIKEHLNELKNYLNSFDIEATIKKRNKRKLLLQVYLKMDMIKYISEEMDRRLSKLPVISIDELILT